MVAGDSSARDGGAGVKVVRPILVWPWNENARAKQKQQTNGNGAIWLVCRTVTNVRGFWLVKRTLGWKNFMLEKPSRNQSILRFDIILQHDWPIEQRLLHIRVFFGGKTKRPCFDLFIYWMIKQITNTYRNDFSRSYDENRSSKIRQVPCERFPIKIIKFIIWQCRW